MQRANGRAAGDTPARGTGIFPAGRGYSRWAGEYPRRPGMFSMGREYSRGRGYSRWAGPGIFPPAGDIPNGGRGYPRRPPGIFPIGLGIFYIPAGRGAGIYSRWVRGLRSDSIGAEYLRVICCLPSGYPKSEFIGQKACWRVHVAVRDQMSICGVVWTTAVHIMPTRKPPALDASVEATKRLVEAAAR